MNIMKFTLPLNYKFMILWFISKQFKEFLRYTKRIKENKEKHIKPCSVL